MKGAMDALDPALAAEAQLAEMELAKARHEYVGVADVAGAWGEVLSAVRGRLLSMPTTLATIVANENEVARCQEIIERHVHEALTELSGYEPGIDAGRFNGAAGNGDRGNDGATAAAQAKRRPVGRPRKAAKLRS
jgi:hypothetical protein